MLRRFGEFDEISLGGGWLNQIVVRFMMRDTLSEAATPSLVILANSLEIGVGGEIELGPDSLVLRLSGIREIANYAARLSPGVVGVTGNTNTNMAIVPTEDRTQLERKPE